MSKKPIINLINDAYDAVPYVGRKISAVIKVGKRKKIKSCDVYFEWNCECCGSSIAVADKNGQILGRAISGYYPYR